MIEETKFETFREQHAQLSFLVAALMVAVLRQREAEHMVALGQLGNAGGVKTEVNYHKSKIKALVAGMCLLRRPVSRATIDPCSTRFQKGRTP